MSGDYRVVCRSGMAGVSACVDLIVACGIRLRSGVRQRGIYLFICLPRAHARGYNLTSLRDSNEEALRASFVLARAVACFHLLDLMPRPKRHEELQSRLVVRSP